MKDVVKEIKGMISELNEDDRRELIGEIMDVEDVQAWADGIIGVPDELSDRVGAKDYVIASVIKDQENHWITK